MDVALGLSSMPVRSSHRARLVSCNAMANYARDFWICLGLFAAALATRLVMAAQLPFPPLDDPAFYIQTARNLVGGRGLVIDVVYNFWVPFNSVTHPSHDYWMPLTTLVMAGFMRVLGDTLLAAQALGILASALLPVVTYLIGRRVWPHEYRWSVLAALLIVPGAIPLYQAAAADSMALYTLLGTAALAAGAIAIDHRRILWAGIAGILCGLSYLTRSHGSLIPIAIALAGIGCLWHERRTLIKLLLAGALGYFSVALPWWLRNQIVFGTAQPIPLAALAFAVSGSEWYNYGLLPSWTTAAAHGWGTLIGLRLGAMAHNLGVALLVTFPYGIIGLPVGLFNRRMVFRVFALYTLLLFCGVSWLIPTSSQTGSFYHSAGILIPWAALGFVMAIKQLVQIRRARLALATYAAALGLVIGQSFLAWPGIAADSQVNRSQFQAIADWLQRNVPPGEPIITTQANTLNYATGHPALTLPTIQDVSVLRQLADRYGVRYVVITERSGLYPKALDDPGARATLVATLPDTFIYELER
jgi:hypothetical protein